MRKVLLIFALALVLAAPAMAKDFKVSGCIQQQGGLPVLVSGEYELYFKGTSYGPAFKDADQGLEICGCPFYLDRDPPNCEMELTAKQEYSDLVNGKLWIVQKVKKYKKK